MTYQERRKSTAKRHADRYNAGGRREYAGGPLLRNDPEHMMDEAEVTVAAQAEAIREVWRKLNGDTIASMSLCEIHLEGHGYIEPKTEEDEVK